MSPLLHKHHRHFHPDTLQKADAGRQDASAEGRPRFDFRGLLEAFVQRVGTWYARGYGGGWHHADLLHPRHTCCADPDRHRTGSRVSVSLVLHAAELGDGNTLHPLYAACAVVGALSRCDGLVALR